MNTCTGWPLVFEGSAGGFGLTATVIVIGWFQLVLSKVTVGAPPPPPSALKRLVAVRAEHRLAVVEQA